VQVIILIIMIGARLSERVLEEGSEWDRGISAGEDDTMI
jgi:hypothetical protein